MLQCDGRFFGQEGWPSSTVVRGVPSKEDDQSALIDVLQDWKSAHYQELVGEAPTLRRLPHHLVHVDSLTLDRSLPASYRCLLSNYGSSAAGNPSCDGAQL